VGRLCKQWLVCYSIVQVYACVAKWCILSPWRMATEKNAIRKPCWKSFYSSAVYYIVSKLVNPCGLLTTDHHNANLFHVEVNNKQLCIQLQGPRSSSSNWMNFQLHQWSRRRRCLVHSPHPTLTRKHHWPVHSQFPFTKDHHLGHSPHPTLTRKHHWPVHSQFPFTKDHHLGHSPHPSLMRKHHWPVHGQFPFTKDHHLGHSPHPSLTRKHHHLLSVIGKTLIVSIYIVQITMGASNWPQIHKLWHKGEIYPAGFLVFGLVFVSRDF